MTARPWTVGTLRRLTGVSLALFLGACGSDDAGPPCAVDDDCEAQVSRRACVDGRCREPGCPEGMIYVGKGSYARGCPATDMTCPAIAQPEHQVTLTRGVCIATRELTVARFRACVAAGTCEAPAALQCSRDGATWTATAGTGEELPINCLRWSDAAAACAFQGGRLPTEAEWEKAARGRDKRLYPFGSAAPTTCDGINWGGGSGCGLAPWPVGSGKGDQAQSAAGPLDMAGNVWEWTSDWYATDSYASCAQGCSDPVGPASGTVRVRRGGSYLSPSAVEVRAYSRDYHTPEGIRSDIIGVRCAADLPR